MEPAWKAVGLCREGVDGRGAEAGLRPRAIGGEAGAR